MTRDQTLKPLPIHVKLENGSKGPLLASGYTRLVVGGRGPYLEISPEQLLKDQIEIEPGQEYRLKGDWKEKVYYAWHRTVAGHRKVYEQFRYVGYADYVPGYYYISPDDAVFEGELYKETSGKQKQEEPSMDFDGID